MNYFGVIKDMQISRIPLEEVERFGIITMGRWCDYVFKKNMWRKEWDLVVCFLVCKR